MRARIRFTINLPNDFRVGSCKDCPYHEVSEFETSYQAYTKTERCLLKFDKVTCPIEPMDGKEGGE